MIFYGAIALYYYFSGSKWAVVWASLSFLMVVFHFDTKLNKFLAGTKKINKDETI